MEQPTATQEPSSQEDQPEIGSILSEGLRESEATPQTGTQAEEKPIKEQVPPAASEEPPFIELVLDEMKKLPFKTEDEFYEFLEKNKILKEGWLRQSDYTRKTQELSKHREEIERRIREEDSLWDKVKPDLASKQALASLWNVYQTAEPIVAEAIQQFMEDVNLISHGQAPVGPLKSEVQGTSTSSQPEVLQLRSEISKLNQELKKFQASYTERERQTFEIRQAQERESADRQVDEWISGKEKSGTKVSENELLLMADFMSVMDEKGQPKFSLDEAYDLALAKLGKTKAAAVKEVLEDTKNLKKKSSPPPSSKTSASEEPEPKSIGDILAQGARQLGG